MHLSFGSLGAGLTVLALWGLLAASGSALAVQIGPEVVLLEAGRPDLSKQWAEAVRHEFGARRLERDQPEEAAAGYLRAARLFDGILAEQPQLSAAYWRSARAYWAAAEVLPVEAKADRIEYFERAEARTKQGIEVDPECAECMLWKFAAMGRLRTTKSLFMSVGELPGMAHLLDRGIELEPTYADGPDNSTLGNLHYSSAIFYRVFPDWFWLGWIMGIKGDKERALEHSRSALAIHPDRLDYQIELGCQLLCLGSSRGDDAVTLEGKKIMQAAILREPETQDDEREIAAAQIMLQQPKKSCGYSGDSWIEISRSTARRAAVSSNRAP